jgi:hypothetical protein
VTDWPEIIALADQLRVLARAALAAEMRAVDGAAVAASG